MKKEQHICKKLLKAVAGKIAKKEYLEWPPGCHGFSYQPMRPTKPARYYKDKQ